MDGCRLRRLGGERYFSDITGRRPPAALAQPIARRLEAWTAMARYQRAGRRRKRSYAIGSATPRVVKYLGDLQDARSEGENDEGHRRHQRPAGARSHSSQEACSQLPSHRTLPSNCLTTAPPSTDEQMYRPSSVLTHWPRPQ